MQRKKDTIDITDTQDVLRSLVEPLEESKNEPPMPLESLEGLFGEAMSKRIKLHQDEQKLIGQDQMAALDACEEASRKVIDALSFPKHLKSTLGNK